MVDDVAYVMYPGLTGSYPSTVGEGPADMSKVSDRSIERLPSIPNLTPSVTQETKVTVGWLSL